MERGGGRDGGDPVVTTPIEHWWLASPRTVTRQTETIPDPGPGEVRVRLAYTAISPGSNVHVYRAGAYGPSGEGVPQELLYMGSGSIEALGPDVTGIAVGDRVVIRGTGHQSAIVVQQSAVLRLPDGLLLRDAALSYLPSWSVSALHLGRYAAAETVVVTGLGLVGASAALVADAMGARVLALDIDPARVAFGRALGLGAVAQVGTDEGDRVAAAYLGSAGPDLVLETTGAWAGLGEAIRRSREFTRIAIMGIYRTPPPAELGMTLYGMLSTYPAKFHHGRLSFIGVGSDPDEVVAPNPSLATTRTNHRWVLEQAARGRLPLGRLVTEVLPPAAIGDALERLANGETRLVGVVFDWETATE